MSKAGEQVEGVEGEVECADAVEYNDTDAVERTNDVKSHMTTSDFPAPPSSRHSPYERPIQRTQEGAPDRAG